MLGSGINDLRTLDKYFQANGFSEQPPFLLRRSPFTSLHLFLPVFIFGFLVPTRALFSAFPYNFEYLITHFFFHDGGECNPSFLLRTSFRPL